MSIDQLESICTDLHREGNEHARQARIMNAIGSSEIAKIHYEAAYKINEIVRQYTKSSDDFLITLLRNSVIYAWKIGRYRDVLNHINEMRTSSLYGNFEAEMDPLYLSAELKRQGYM